MINTKFKTMATTKKKWLQSAIKHTGRCKVMGSKECPKGSPQYNLAITLKKNHGFHKTKKK